MMSASEEQLNTDDLQRPSDNEVDDEDDVNVSANIKHNTNRNNLSGSYSNLFRADRTDDESTEVVVQRPTAHMEAADLIGAGMLRENVYSNVPFGSASELASSTLLVQPSEGNREPASSDPSLHVYSNVATAVGGKGVAVHDMSFGGVSAIFAANATSPTVAESLMQMRRFSGEGQSSSTMMTDDLDLDDAVMGAGAFSQSNANDSNPPSNFPKKKSAVSIELTNVIPQVRFGEIQSILKFKIFTLSVCY